MCVFSCVSHHHAVCGCTSGGPGESNQEKVPQGSALCGDGAFCLLQPSDCPYISEKDVVFFVALMAMA